MPLVMAGFGSEDQYLFGEPTYIFSAFRTCAPDLEREVMHCTQNAVEAGVRPLRAHQEVRAMVIVNCSEARWTVSVADRG